MLRFHGLVSVEKFRYFSDWQDDETERPHSFAKRTVIYGPNGSGKSTLADIFNAIERRQRDPNEADERLAGVRFRMTDGNKITTCSGDDPNLPRVLVFGEDYINRNLRKAFEEPDALGEPLYVIGERDADLDAQIENKKSEVEQVNKAAEKASTDWRRAERQLDEITVEIREEVQDSLAAYDPGKYNKTRFNKKQVKKLIDRSDDFEVLKPDELEKERANLGKQAEDVAGDVEIPKAPDVTKLAADLNELAQLDVVARTLDDLADNRPLADWAQAGLHLHEPGDSCGFCGSTVREDRLADLRAHFDESYRRLQDQVSRLRDQLEALEERLEESETTIVDLGERKGDTGVWVSAQRARFERFFEQSRAWSAAARALLDARTEDPFAEAHWTEPVRPDGEVWEELAAKARRENAALATERQQVDATRQEAAEAILEHIGARRRERYKQALRDVEQKSRADKNVRDKAKQLKEELAELESNLMEERDGEALANKLDMDLQRYLGPRRLRVKFRKREDQAGFVFLRGDEPAQHLSEGERGAVALLHFLRSLDTDENRPELPSTCVVIDDPVSSFDNDGLAAAFGFIAQKMQQSPTNKALRCGQLVILTHNFHFFQLWRESLARLARRDLSESKDASLAELANRRVAMLELRVSLPKDGPRRSALRELGHGRPGKSEYHLLFDYVCRAVSGDTDDDTALLAGNAGRRLVESFVRWRLPQEHSLAAAVRTLGAQSGVEPDIISRVERSLSIASHRTEVDMTTFQYAGDVTNELRAALAFIRKVDKGHFVGMCKANHVEPVLEPFV